MIHRGGVMAERFRDRDVTADGQQRAHVELVALQTLWFNTGTLCNLTCANCYIESSPKNDRLAYLSVAEVNDYLDQIAALHLPTAEIGITGGEPFMNPHIIEILEACLARGLDTLVLTNAMLPMMKRADDLLTLHAKHGAKLALRVSIDHHRKALHEAERGKRTWAPTLRGLRWLADNGFKVRIAGRLRWGDDETDMRSSFARLLAREGVALNVLDPQQLVLFPEMDESAVVPEITKACWDILHKQPTDVMCSSSRMVVKHRGAAQPTVVSCTLIPYSAGFDTGPALADALGPVKLNHPHCAKFCVLGGGRCSA